MKAKIAILAASALALLALPAAAAAAPALDVSGAYYPDPVPAGTGVQYTLQLKNTGTTTTSGNITLTFTAPAGMVVTSATAPKLSGIVTTWTCTVPNSQTATCTGPGTGFGQEPAPGQQACGGACPITVNATTAKADANSVVTPTVHASGGGAPAPFDGSLPTAVGDPPSFRLTSFDGRVLKADGSPATEAGSRPFLAATDFTISTILADGAELGTEDLRDASVELPPGLVGNPQAYPTCAREQLAQNICPLESQLGNVTIDFDGPNLGSPGNPDPATVAVYNMPTPHGAPALFGFYIEGALIYIYPSLRTGADYGLTVTSLNAPETLSFQGIHFTFWGVPADSGHDPERRGPGCAIGGCAITPTPPLKPFLSLPTSCTGPVLTALDVISWLGSTDTASFLSHDNGGNPIGADNCNAVPFAPTLEARPTTNVADAPSGLDVDLRVPQQNGACDPGPPVGCGLATAHLKDTTVTLPEGLVVNPASANGLGACSLAQFGYTSTDPDATIHTTPDPATCPDASRLADVEVNTPLLDHPLRGSAFIAEPFANPFNSLLALYISIDDPQTGIVAKLAGEVSLDPATGQVSATFVQNPQLPFEHFRLHFKSGAHGALRTPATCDADPSTPTVDPYTTTSSLTPWSAPDSGPPAEPSDTWQITQGCANSPAEAPNAPSFDAGVVSPIAGQHSPFVVHLRREDGSQNFSAITLSPPQGLVAKLAGTAICSEADLAAAAAKSGAGEKASPSCPASSEVGQVVAGAGAGPAPYYAHGKAYMSGPYKGAPLSLAIVTPATAGPFDLGTIVVRTALYVDSKTAQIKAVSDPIPEILQGIPLDVKTVDVALDRPDFTLNPTSCDPMAVNGLLTSTLGQVASLSSRFQLGECTALGFKPRMTLRLRGGTKRGKHPALTIALMPRAGDANIASVSVALPRSEFLENAHIRTVCTRPDFAADACPAAAVYGEATVDTPLLDYDLAGHVYLRSSDNLLPDVVPDLRGPAYQPIRLETAGRTDSIRGGIRTTIDFVPDAPFTKATVALQGGNKGLLVNSRNICDRVYRATVKYTAHNGLTFTAHPALRAKCGGRGKRGKGKRRGHRRAGR